MYCKSCGKQVVDQAEVCPHCGVRVSVGSKKWLTALLLCIFLGIFGAHRFYVGKAGTGVVQLLTAGGLGVWTLIDFIMILVGSFKDKDGNSLVK